MGVTPSISVCCGSGLSSGLGRLSDRIAYGHQIRQRADCSTFVALHLNDGGKTDGVFPLPHKPSLQQRANRRMKPCKMYSTQCH